MLYIKKYCFPLLLFCLINCSLPSCKKDWLDAKPDQALVVPTSLRDYQSLLDNNSSGTVPFNINQNILGELSSDDGYLTDDSYDFIPTIHRNAYVWASDIYGGDIDHSAWASSYNGVFVCNLILEGIQKIVPSNNSEQQQWNQIKGSALFFRSYRLFEVADLYCKPYDKITAKTDPGIPIRLKSDFNTKSTRASVEETYNQILNDLKEAANILPIEKPGLEDKDYKLRPTKAAANAMLARVYLAMGLYDDALIFSSKLLSSYSDLMDYNDNVSQPGFFKLPMFNKEVIFHMTGATEIAVGIARLLVDSTLSNSYDLNDRRKELFIYSAAPFFLGNYTGSGTLFTGLATDEMYLIKSECLARQGKKDDALVILNQLMKNRWNNSVTYPEITAVDANDALHKVLIERRKELCYRCIRWSDLRRLNKDSQFETTLQRRVKGAQYLLPPKSPKYILPIPQDVIQLTGMEQNQR